MLGLGLSLTSLPLLRGGGGASLDLDLTTTTADTLDSRATFSRASLAWQYDSTGTLVTAPHNLLTDSHGFDGSGWSKSETTVSANVLANPLDGAVNADKILDSTNNAVHQVFQSITFTTGLTYIFSVYAKGAERTFLSIACPASLGSGISEFDLSAGTATRDGTMVAAGVTVAITAVGSAGWYRCSLSGTATSTASGAFGMRLRAVSGTSTYTGTGTSGLYLFGAQLAQYGGAVRPYLPTSVKNLIGFSEQVDNAAWTKTNASVTAGATTAPDGAVSADLLTENSTASVVHRASQTVTTLVVGTPYTWSVYVKASTRNYARLEVDGGGVIHVSLITGAITASTASGTSVTSVGNGWYRISLQSTTAATSRAMYVYGLPDSLAAVTTNSWNGDGASGIYVWGAMCASSGSLDAYSPTNAAAPSSAAYYGPAVDYQVTASVTNLLLRSQEFDHALWTSWNGATPVVTANAAVAPDGTTTADSILFNTTNWEWRMQSTTIPNNSSMYVASVYYKAGTAASWQLQLNLTGGSSTIISTTIVNSDGTVNYTTHGGTSTAVGGGWFRVTAFGPNNSTGNTTAEVGVQQHNFVQGTVIVWGAQLEQASSMGTYVPTTSTTAWTNTTSVLGLRLEEAKTNLVAGDLTVAATWPAIGSVTRAAGAAAPDGTTNGVVFTEPAGGTISYGFNSSSVTVTAFSATTCSIFAKAGTCTVLRMLLAETTGVLNAAQAWFNLTTGTVGTYGASGTGAPPPSGIVPAIQSIGGGWFRCSLTCNLNKATTSVMLIRLTSADSATSDTGSKTMSFYAPQIEVGAAPSSPILTTTTASVARGADSLLFAPLGGWFNPAAGTVAVETYHAEVGPLPGNRMMWHFDDGGSNNRIYLVRNGGSGKAEATMINGGVQQVLIAHASAWNAGINNHAYAWATNDVAASFNGATAAVDIVATIPTVTQLRTVSSGGAYPVGYLRKLKYWSTRKSNAEVQALSTGSRTGVIEVRLAETSDNRITEAGDRRILE